MHRLSDAQSRHFNLRQIGDAESRLFGEQQMVVASLERCRALTKINCIHTGSETTKSYREKALRRLFAVAAGQ